MSIETEGKTFRLDPKYSVYSKECNFRDFEKLGFKIQKIGFIGADYSRGGANVNRLVPIPIGDGDKAFVANLYTRAYRELRKITCDSIADFEYKVKTFDKLFPGFKFQVVELVVLNPEGQLLTFKTTKEKQFTIGEADLYLFKLNDRNKDEFRERELANAIGDMVYDGCQYMEGTSRKPVWVCGIKHKRAKRGRKIPKDDGLVPRR